MDDILWIAPIVALVFAAAIYLALKPKNHHRHS